MIFNFEMSANEVKRNTKFVLITSCPFGISSVPIHQENFRQAVAFYTCRSGGLFDSRNKKNWFRNNDMYLSPSSED